MYLHGPGRRNHQSPSDSLLSLLAWITPPDDYLWTYGASRSVASPAVSVNTERLALNGTVTEVGSPWFCVHQLVYTDERGSEGYHVTGNRTSGIKAHRWQSVSIQIQSVACSPRSSEVEMQGSRVTLDLLCLPPLLSAPVPQGKLISRPKQIALSLSHSLSLSVHGHHTSVTAMTEGFTCFWRGSNDTSTVVMDHCVRLELVIHNL